ncbi:hypothetical protein JOF41_006743 [Saccharothrix coeruleofusca]|uniref:DUF4232 domain-containing protein n=1 Tax=Saccharothrix coeruleofusca TaxID=33919 RepID=UPI001AE9A890|nr:DUF4232 domain-containing protein [Saccharothrix coeruleofusca]MBP2340565.1 hypothetical protein [Saccharothrix coeruleofusca]
MMGLTGIGSVTAVTAALLVGGATGADAVVDAAAGAATCRSVGLDVSFGREEGAAGTVYREVLLTNRGVRPCVLRGFPGVSYVDGDGAQIGGAAERVGDRGPQLTLRHGETAASDVGFAQVRNFDPDVCQPTPVWGVRVYPPDETEPLYLDMDQQLGCAGDASRVGAHLTVASVRS